MGKRRSKHKVGRMMRTARENGDTYLQQIEDAIARTQEAGNSAERADDEPGAVPPALRAEAPAPMDLDGE